MSIVTFSPLGSMGELGNQMFQIASTIGYGDKFGKEAIFPEWKCKISGRDYTNILETPLNQKFNSKVVLNHRISHFGLDFQEFINLPGNIDLQGYFQSEKYFEHCANKIKELFVPSSSIKNYLESRYSYLMSIKNKAVLQVRTYKRFQNDYDVHAGATKELIEKSQTYIDADVYVVFSDRMDLAKKILPCNKNYIFIEGNQNYEDLFLMTYFEKYIITASTFGWWGAWLSQCNNPKVAISKNWFTIGKDKEPLNNNNIIPDRWIKIE